MSSLIDEAIALANEADVSVPAFIQIDPNTGAVGLNFVATNGQALGFNTRYMGLYSSFLGTWPVAGGLPAPIFKDGDWIDFVAAQGAFAPHDPLQIWRGRWHVFQNQNGNRANFIGGSPLVAARNTADLINPNGAFILDPNLPTITVPYTGQYYVRATGEWATAATINAHTDNQGIWVNGANVSQLSSHSFLANSSAFGATFAWDYFSPFNAGDVIGLSWFSNAGNINLTAIARTLQLFPQYITNS